MLAHLLVPYTWHLGLDSLQVQHDGGLLELFLEFIAVPAACGECHFEKRLVLAGKGVHMVFNLPKVELDALAQELVVSQYRRWLVGTHAFSCSAKRRVHASSHSTVQPCVQHGQQAGCQISHIHLALGIADHPEESRFVI